jgi:hypothetical protein
MEPYEYDSRLDAVERAADREAQHYERQIARLESDLARVRGESDAVREELTLVRDSRDKLRALVEGIQALAAATMVRTWPLLIDTLTRAGFPVEEPKP